MSVLPAIDRLLLGPGPSPVSPRVARALATPVLGHLDPLVLGMMDDIRARLLRIFRAPEGSLALAVSGSGTAAMETSLANVVEPGRRIVVVTNGYFGDRIAHIAERLGGEVHRVTGEWGRAIDPAAVEAAVRAHGPAIVAVVHAETSTGVLNPVPDIARIARSHDALTLVDAVTSLGGMPVDVAGWGVDVCYSGSQKCLGAPSGLAPLVFTPRALERRVSCRSYYFDLGQLEAYWIDRKYHHTIASTLVYALGEALAEVEEEGLDVRCQRHARHHDVFTRRLHAIGLRLLPPDEEQLWTLHTVVVPDGIDEARIRLALRDELRIEIGSGIGSLAGRIWRVGLMGAGSTPSAIALLVAAFEQLIARERAGAGRPAAHAGRS
jgi:alanine-glyoxylate transaminase/serine-glyoxylate transaminase/serine-pyruvate transaminase